MKRLFTFIFVLELVCSFLYAIDGKTAVQLVKPETKNLSKTESSWITGSVRDKLKSNLQDYAGLKTVVDESNEDALYELQAKSENAAYDEEEIIEAGKMTTAQNVIFTTITYSGSKYTLSCNFTNLTTGEDKTAVSSGKKTINELCDGTGNAADEVTLILCEKLNIPLTATQKYYLKNGSAELSVKEQYELEKKNFENLNSQIEEIKKEIKLNTSSLEQTANAKEAKLRAEQATMEEKQAAAARRMEALEEQSKKIMEDQLKEAERSLEMKKLRDKIASEASKKAASIRKEILESQPVIGQIKVIESKKRALIELRENNDKRINEIKAEYDKIISKKTNEILTAPYASTELDNGVPVQEAVEYRNSKIAIEKEKINQEKLKEIKAIEKAFVKQDTALFKEIKKDLYRIRKKHSVNSFGEELKVDYQSFSGNEKGWKGTVYLYSDQMMIFKANFIMSYSALTGKAVPSYSDEAKRKEYDSEVDMYSSLLFRGEPILNYQLDYSINPLDDNHPSSYKLQIHEFKIKFTSTERTVETPILSETSVIREMVPTYDIRSKSETFRQNTYNHDLGGGSLTGISLGGGINNIMSPAAIISFKKGLTHTFSFIDIGINGSSEHTEKVRRWPFMFYAAGGFGFNFRPMIFNNPPAIYFSAGGGLAIQVLKEEIEYFASNSNGTYSTNSWATYGIAEATVGLQKPLTSGFAIFAEGKLFYIFDDVFPKGNISYSATAGISFIKP